MYATHRYYTHSHIHVTPAGGGGGGYSVWKRVPTVDRVLLSCGCREQTMLKKGGCPVIIDDYRELSNRFILGFYIKLQSCSFKVVQETFKTSNLVKSNQINNEIQRSVSI